MEREGEELIRKGGDGYNYPLQTNSIEDKKDLKNEVGDDFLAKCSVHFV